ncbi:S53 family peptidase [Actinocatenispora rupis]|uniref:Serine protease n=1 Tax=Actinocatenispora rupis TaxID=519421 RepID=A0A8J3N8M6_9ACTN|nr:S53 family peptidase [Actinocatenispora rupis]GID10251.1 serine protease [Actinocatenispora rupis]
MRHTLIRRAAIAAGATALVLPFAASAATAAPIRHAVPGSTPAWATSANRSGTPQSSDRVGVQVFLNLRDADSAERLATAVSTPGNRQYGHYLSPAQFNKRFAPSDASVQQVSSYLKGQGLSVDGTAAGNRYIDASGTVAQLDKAFGTTLSTYRYKGHSLRAPSRQATLPSSVANLVLSVNGLAETAPLRTPFHHRASDPASAKTRSAAPSAAPAPAKCSTFWGEHHQTLPKAYGRTEFPTYLCGYTPDQLQSGYGVKGPIAKGTDGSGTTVAIVDAYASPTMQADADRYAQENGQGAYAAGQYSEKVFKPFDMQDECGGEDGWNGEEAIDVEAAHATAPGATIRYVGAKNCDTGLDEALNWIIQNRSADIVSDSWGNTGEDIPASSVKAEHTIFVQAAAEGIGMYFSSGDSGDEVTAGNTPSAQPDFPASDPYVTAVGGTSMALGSDNSYQFETGWGTDVAKVDYTQNPAAYASTPPGEFVFGAGGGTSTLFDQPRYQRGVVPSSLSRAYGGTPARVVPDVAALADPYTGMAVGRTIDGTYTVETWGGTSLACPLFAGVQAVASTHRHVAIGFANPMLYSMYKSSAYRDVLPQRTPVAVATPSGSALVTFDHDSSLAAARGYDDVTGLGTPNGAKYVQHASRG